MGELNESYVKVLKVKGEFTWHSHQNEDELFLVVKGKMKIRFRDRDVEHMPVADEEAHVILLEPKSVLNTGDVKNEKTLEKLDWV